MSDNTFDIKGGSNQILPNATEAKQNIYIGDSAIKIALQQSKKTIDNDIAEKEPAIDTHSALIKHQSPLNEVQVSQKGNTMKIAILHLSDLHIEKDNYQWLLKKAEQMVPAVWNDFFDCEKIIIVVTGDIANAGSEEQYGYAKEFFRTLLKEIAKRGLAGRELENKIICVPGNHDCNYDKGSGARARLLNSMRSNQDEIDESIYTIISGVQDEFRTFAREIMIDKDYTLGINNNITVKAGDKTILFRLYNTAWMSVKKEEQGSIVLPMEMVEQECGDADMVISLFHHHYGWITPGFDNNKNRFRKHIMRSSNMALYGHEHTPSSSQVRDNFEGEVINEFQGGSLCMKQQAGSRGSSFNCFVVDLNSFQCTVRPYVYTEGLYVCRKEETVNLNRERKTDEFRHNPDFEVVEENVHPHPQQREREDDARRVLCLSRLGAHEHLSGEGGRGFYRQFIHSRRQAVPSCHAGGR